MSNSPSYNFNKNLPSFKTKNRIEQEKILDYILDVYIGKSKWFNEADDQIVDIRKAYRYLPKESDEQNTAYFGRLKRSRFDRKFRETIQESANYIYNLAVLQDTPEPILKLLDNVDLNGNNLKNFLKLADIHAIRDGSVGILIDAPSAPDEDYNQLYLCLIDIRNIPNWKYTNRNGRQILDQLTIKETVSELSENFEELEYTQYRIIRPGYYEIWREYENNMELIDEGETSFSEIPFVIYHVDPEHQQLSTQSQPPLMDLASLNLVHYRKVSNNDELIRKCTIPVFVVRFLENGVIDSGNAIATDDDGNIIQGSSNNLPQYSTSIGANTVLYNVDAEFVEPSGQSMAAIRQDIMDVEMAIEAKKNSFQLGHAQPLTAEEVIRVSSSNDVNIAAMAASKENVVRKIFKLFARYMKLDEENCGGVTVSLEEIRKVQSRANQTYYDMLLRHGVITPENLARSIAKNLPIQDVISLNESEN